MVASAHVLAGFICGLAAAPTRSHGIRIIVAFGLGVASHLILDAIPHSDYGNLSRNTILAVVLLEVCAAIGFAWFLLRSRRIPGWRTALPAGVFGASIPDVKFLAPYFPPDAANGIVAFAENLHSPFHAAPMRPALELSAELVTTILLAGTLALLARHPGPGRRPTVVREAAVMPPNSDG